MKLFSFNFSCKNSENISTTYLCLVWNFCKNKVFIALPDYQNRTRVKDFQPGTQNNEKRVGLGGLNLLYCSKSLPSKRSTILEFLFHVLARKSGRYFDKCTWLINTVPDNVRIGRVETRFRDEMHGDSVGNSRCVWFEILDEFPQVRPRLRLNQRTICIDRVNIGPLAMRSTCLFSSWLL